MLIVVY